MLFYFKRNKNVKIYPQNIAKFFFEPFYKPEVCKKFICRKLQIAKLMSKVKKNDTR